MFSLGTPLNDVEILLKRKRGGARNSFNTHPDKDGDGGGGAYGEHPAKHKSQNVQLGGEAGFIYICTNTCFRTKVKQQCATIVQHAVVDKYDRGLSWRDDH